MRNWLRAIVIGTAVGAATFASTASAQSVTRSPMDLMRSQLLRLHGRLMHEALLSSDIEQARQEAARAFAALYQIRENLLSDLRKDDAYTDLRLALWHQQQQLAGIHLEVPVRIARIMAGAKDSLALRTQINRMETQALEASDDYVAARDDMNAKVAAYQRAVNEALARVREDPQLMSLSQQVQAAQRAAAGRPPGGIAHSN